MIKLIKDLKEENERILKDFPLVNVSFGKSSPEYRYMFNKEIISILDKVKDNYVIKNEAINFVKFSILCDRKNMPLLDIDDFLKL